MVTRVAARLCETAFELAPPMKLKRLPTANLTSKRRFAPRVDCFLAFLIAAGLAGCTQKTEEDYLYKRYTGNARLSVDGVNLGDTREAVKKLYVPQQPGLPLRLDLPEKGAWKLQTGATVHFDPSGRVSSLYQGSSVRAGNEYLVTHGMTVSAVEKVLGSASISRHYKSTAGIMSIPYQVKSYTLRYNVGGTRFDVLVDVNNGVTGVNLPAN
jgi:hypothetical protein